MPPTLPPYALRAPSFPFRNLASLAGRAPIGGAREVALACFVAARLAVACSPSADDDAEGRSSRASGAKAWLGALNLPAAVRGPVGRCAELSADGDCAGVARELSALLAAASTFLDAQSRNELETLATTLRG